MTGVVTFVTSVVGWAFSYLYFAGLLGPEIATCTMASDDGWSSSLVSLSLLIVGIGLMAVGLRWARLSRWLAVPLIPVLPYACKGIGVTLVDATIMGRHVCDSKVWPDTYGLAAAWWHPWWAPLQLVGVLGFVAFFAWYWKKARALTNRLPDERFAQKGGAPIRRNRLRFTSIPRASCLRCSSTTWGDPRGGRECT